ncbi:MAG: hypothetical protein LJF30_26235, partial [Acidobacteria bacterium]|nr:hypothetical protein [Acidobacteriota bacterium]
MADDRGNPWLTMVYLAGDNNLTEEMVLALQNLMAEGLPEKEDRIVAQFDPSGVGLFSQRYDFSDDTNPDGTKKTRLEEYIQPYAIETNTGSPAVLKDFLDWALGKYKWCTAENRKRNLLLILSGHGSGTTQDFLLK